MRNRFISLTEFYNHFSRIDKKPNFLDIISIVPLLLFLGMLKEFKIVIRSYKSNRLPTEPTFNNDKNIPKVTLLIVAEQKDFELIPFSLKQALINSRNLISRVVFITPSRQIESCRRIVNDFQNQVVMEFISEDAIVNRNVRELIKREFKNRYGWILQQFATVAFLLEESLSGSIPVLALDADTLLTRPTTFINKENKQVLLCSTEYHQPYYVLINKLSNDLCHDKLSFISHHMIYQPDLFRTIFRDLNIDSIEKLLKFVLENYDKKSESPICVEFEIYAQWLVKNFRAKIELLKFSNISISREHFLQNPDLAQYSGYKSVSLHSYLG